MTKEWRWALALVLICLWLPSMAWGGTLTPAAGGGAMPPETVGGDFIELSGPVYEEARAGEIGMGTIVLQLPAGFEWDTGTLPRARVEKIDDRPGGQTINGVSSGGTFPADAIDATQVTFTITQSSSARANRLTFEGLRVRPISLTPPASGNITHRGTSTINNVVTGSTSWGYLAQQGAAKVLLSANGEYSGPVAVEVGQDVVLQVEASSCPAAELWRDIWTIDGDTDRQLFTTSPCQDSPFGRTENLAEPGQYSASYTSEYCTNYFWGFCWSGWVEHGQDTITLDVGDVPSECFVESFDGGDGPLGEDWVTDISGGDFTPQIVNGRLRMTEASGQQATAATLQREIPGAGNLVVIEFDFFAYGGSGADGLAVVLSDASVSPRAGGFGGSLGYANRTGIDGFAGGWLGFGLDEFGNFSNATEDRNGGNGFIRDAVAIRGSGNGQTGYKYLAGTGTLNPGIDETGSTGSGHTYRITIDSRVAGEALVSVERDSGAGFVELISPFNVLQDPDQATVPENLLFSLTGSTGGSTNVHELGSLEVCALQLNPIGDRIDHFELVHDGVALTCQPATVGIRACSNADCSEPFTDPVTVTMAPAGWIGGDSFSFSGGYTERQLQKTSAQSVLLDVTESTPTTKAFAETLCQVGGAPPDASQCELLFQDSGLAFQVPNLIANRPSESLKIRAIQRDDETNACVPAFTDVTRTVHFWSDYVDPGSTARPASWPVFVNETAAGLASTDATAIDLAFDGAGEAEVTVRYPDAGQMQLHAHYTGSAVTEDEGLEMPGSDPFLSSPAGFCVKAETSCPEGDANCPVFGTAGDPFDLTIGAMAWESDTDGDLCEGNGVTPNFRLGNVALEHTLVAPGGGEPGTLVTTAYDHQADPGGETVVSQQVAEVGVFTFSAGPADYWGEPIPQAISEPVGRFTPDRFDIATVGVGKLAPSCDTSLAMAYMGEELSWVMGNEPLVSITAHSALGNITQNYTEPGFQRLDAADLLRTPAIEDNTALNADGVSFELNMELVSGLLTVDAPGELSYRFSENDRTTYEKAVNSRVAPFKPDFTVELASLTDADGVTAPDLPKALSPEADFDMRYGRLWLDHAYGPETEPLIVPMQAEYYDGSRFVRNQDDSCWAYDTGSEATLSPGLVSSVSGNTGILLSGRPPVGSELSLTAPGTPGEELVTYAVPLWLQDDFDGNGELEDPSSTATFGVYRGHDRIIYWREVR